MHVTLTPDDGLPHAWVSVDAAPYWSAALLATLQPRGGYSWHWECPSCGRGARALYDSTGTCAKFECRHCTGLTYAVQRMSARDRLSTRMRRVAARVDATPDSALGVFSVNGKKTRMHWRTFERAHDQWKRLEAQRNALMNARFTQLMSRLGQLSY
jgi:hypothetical protein